MELTIRNLDRVVVASVLKNVLVKYTTYTCITQVLGSSVGRRVQLACVVQSPQIMLKERGGLLVDDFYKKSHALWEEVGISLPGPFETERRRVHGKALLGEVRPKLWRIGDWRRVSPHFEEVDMPEPIRELFEKCLRDLDGTLTGTDTDWSAIAQWTGKESENRQFAMMQAHIRQECAAPDLDIHFLLQKRPDLLRFFAKIPVPLRGQNPEWDQYLDLVRNIRDIPGQVFPKLEYDDREFREFFDWLDRMHQTAGVVEGWNITLGNPTFQCVFTIGGKGDIKEMNLFRKNPFPERREDRWDTFTQIVFPKSGGMTFIEREVVGQEKALNILSKASLDGVRKVIRLVGITELDVDENNVAQARYYFEAVCASKREGGGMVKIIIDADVQEIQEVLETLPSWEPEKPV